MTRKRALKKLREVLVDEKHEPAALQSLFSFALKPLLKQFPDSVRIQCPARSALGFWQRQSPPQRG